MGIMTGGFLVGHAQSLLLLVLARHSRQIIDLFLEQTRISTPVLSLFFRSQQRQTRVRGTPVIR